MNIQQNLFITLGVFLGITLGFTSFIVYLSLDLWYFLIIGMIGFIIGMVANGIGIAFERQRKKYWKEEIKKLKKMIGESGSETQK